MTLVRCRDCLHFRQGHGSPQALGRCQAEPWDTFPGQWPDKEHPCTAFASRPAPAAQDAITAPEIGASSTRPACPSSVPPAIQGPLGMTPPKQYQHQPRPGETEQAGHPFLGG